MKEILQNGLLTEIYKPNPLPNHAELRYRIQLYDMPCENPRRGRRSSAIASDLGYIKTSFFTNFGFNKPAVTIFIFDFREHKKEEPWDWKQAETAILS